MLSPTVKLPNRLSLRLAGTNATRSATPPGWPTTSTRPSVGSKPAIARASSRAPEPSTPVSATIEPAATSMSTRENSPWRCVRPCTRRSGVVEMTVGAARARSRSAAPTTSERAISSAAISSPTSVRLMRPSSSTTTLSECSASSLSRWLTSITVRPASASTCMRRKRSSDSSSVSAEFGSSKSTTRASCASARAISVRCWIASGHSSSCRSATSRIARSASSSRSCASIPCRSQRLRSRPITMFSATVRLGKSCGSWCTTATSRAPMTGDHDWPSTRISPASEGVSPARILIIVLLPAPFGPAMPRILPRSATRSSPFSAIVSP